MTTDIALLPLSGLSELIRTRALSPVELAKRYLDRITAIDGLLHSFNSLRAEQALKEATEAEHAIANGN